jgi:FK506-binding protein 8
LKFTFFFFSDKKRQRGNFLYRRKEYSSALQCYQNALKFLDTTEYPLLDEEDNQSSILIDRYIQVQNNLAQVYLLNNKYEECLNAVNNVLKYDSNNIKALFRQSKALIELGNYDHAIQPLKLLLQNPNKDIEKDKVRDMLNLCETKLAKYQKNEKEIYKRMFQSKPTTTTTTVNENLQTENIKKIENKTNNWWTYVAVGSAVLAAAGLAAIIKYR